MDNKDKELAGRLSRLMEVLQEGESWLADNAAMVGNALQSKVTAIRKAERAMRAAKRAALRKMCVGVFGESQTGKSYLVSALCRNQEGVLWAVLGQDKYNFISEINPEGQKESTGLVTRFSIDAPPNAPADHPVYVKLLSELDLAKILANSYYSDAKHADEPNREAIHAEARALAAKKLASRQAPFDDYDMEEFRDYVQQNFASYSRVQALRGYWDAAVQAGPYLPREDRVKLFSIIWNHLPEFTRLFDVLSGALEALGHPEEAYCPVTALIPRTDSIIDVATLKNLLGDDANRLELVTSDGRKANLPRAVVAALTAELSLTMRDKPADFFDYTDLLDFPGYRERLDLRNIAQQVTVPGNLELMFLRGKVAYLFERYYAERELTSLLLCVQPGNQTVPVLPRLIHKWVTDTHGDSPALRKGKKPTLFFIFTKSDMMFDRKSGVTDVTAVWENRLKTSFVDWYGNVTPEDSWPREWADGQAFKNIYMLRNPDFQFRGVLEYEGKKELGVRKDSEEFVDRVKAAFFASPLVQTHFADMHRSWEGLMSLNDGGVSYIRAALEPLCDPDLKRAQIRTSLRVILARIIPDLSVYWENEDRDELRAEKVEEGIRLGVCISNLAEKDLFGLFQRYLMIKDHEIRDLYFQPSLSDETPDQAGPAEALPVKTGAQGKSISLGAIFGAGNEEKVRGVVQSSGIKKEKARDDIQDFAKAILSYFSDRLAALKENAHTRLAMGAQDDVPLAVLAKEMENGLRRYGVDRELEEALRQAARFAGTARETIAWKQAVLAASIINNYVNWLGLDPDKKTALERTVSLGQEQWVLFEPSSFGHGLEALREQPAGYGVSYITDWIRALLGLIVGNVDFDGRTTVNAVQNSRLGKIVKELESESGTTD